jgi:hypothetical protein
MDAVREIAQINECRADHPPSLTVGFGLLLGRVVGS